jgi:hypothetical protein
MIRSRSWLVVITSAIGGADAGAGAGTADGFEVGMVVFVSSLGLPVAVDGRCQEA